MNPMDEKATYTNPPGSIAEEMDNQLIEDIMAEGPSKFKRETGANRNADRSKYESHQGARECQRRLGRAD